MRLKRLRCLCPGVLLIVALGTCPGCSTWLNQVGYWRYARAHGPKDYSPLRDVWWVYGGAATDLLKLREARSFLAPLYFFDLPLSTAADTVLLPMTIVQQVVGIPGVQKKGADSYRQRFSTFVREERELKRVILLDEGVRDWTPFQVSFWGSENSHILDRSYDVRGLRFNLTGIQIGLVNMHRRGWLPVCPLINFGFGGSEENP